MELAERPWPKPTYNVQIGTECQFVVGYGVHGRAGDTSCLTPHLERMPPQLGRLPQNEGTGAGYGGEENCLSGTTRAGELRQVQYLLFANTSFEPRTFVMTRIKTNLSVQPTCGCTFSILPVTPQKMGIEPTDVILNATNAANVRSNRLEAKRKATARSG